MPINNVIVSGNLVSDCEKFMAGETPAISFAIAVNEYSKDKEKEFANYFDCALFGNRAKGLSPFMTKGKKVTVSGRLRQDRWQAEDGSNRSKVRIIVNDVDFASARKDDEKDAKHAAENVPW